MTVACLVVLLQGKFLVEAESSNDIGFDFVRHYFLKVNETAFLMPLLLVVLFIALLEQVQVLVGISNDDVVAVERDRSRQILYSVWYRLRVGQFHLLFIELEHDKD